MQHLLKMDNVSKFYSSHGVVTAGFSRISLAFNSGEFVAITGESGSGKSTLLNVLSGLDSYEEGEMYIEGRQTSGFSGAELEDYRKRYIGNIFQTFNLINNYTVYQNVETVLLLAGFGHREVREKVNAIIDRVGLRAYRRTKASKLSGGQKQRVAIARALAKETPVIVADEPTGNLDVAAAADIIRLLAEVSKDKLVLIVTHNYEQVEPYVTRKIVMHDGHVVEDRRIAPPAAPAEGSQTQGARQASAARGSGADAAAHTGAHEQEKRSAADVRKQEASDAAGKAEAAAGKTAHTGAQSQGSARTASPEGVLHAVPPQGAASAASVQPRAADAAQGVQTARAEGLSFPNTLRLGVRNAFNLPVKFLLLLAVFLLIVLGSFFAYSTFQNMRNAVSDIAYNFNFMDTNKNRLVLTKHDRSAFTDADYAELSKTKNFDKLVKEDVLLDRMIVLSTLSEADKKEVENGKEWGEDTIYLTAKAENIADFSDRLKEGRMPQNDNEVLLLIDGSDEYERQNALSYLDKTLHVYDSMTDQGFAEGIDKTVTITGYGYFTKEEKTAQQISGNYGLCSVAGTPAFLADIQKLILVQGGNIEFKAGEKVFAGGAEGNLPLIATDDVEAGTVYIPEDVAAKYPNGWARGKDFVITNRMLYSTNSRTLTVGAVYSGDNSEWYLGKKYDDMTKGIYMNSADLLSLYESGNYQTTFMMKDSLYYRDTMQALEKVGFKAMYPHNGTADLNPIYNAVMKALSTAVLVVLLLVLFFMSYFIIKLIFKSRNVYFSTVRMLGGSEKTCAGLLLVDMLVVFNIAYIACSAFLWKVKDGTIRAGSFLQEMVKFSEAKDFAILYAVVLLLTVLLAMRYAGQMFKNTAMNAYKEEI